MKKSRGGATGGRGAAAPLSFAKNEKKRRRGRRRRKRKEKEESFTAFTDILPVLRGIYPPQTPIVYVCRFLVALIKLL